MVLLADDAVEPVPVAQLRRNSAFSWRSRRSLIAAASTRDELGQLERLDEEVDRAALDRRDRFFDAAEPGHDDRHDFRVAARARHRESRAVRVGQLQVDDQPVVGEASEPVQGVGAGGRLCDGEALLRQVFRDDGTQLVIVFHDEHARLGT